MFLKTGVYAITYQILHNDGSYLSNYFIHFLFVMKRRALMVIYFQM